MKIDILATAAALSDGDLLARLAVLAGREREASAELVAHLAALDARPCIYAAQGYGSLFAYCTQALRLSEDAACNRIEAARACRRFPVLLDLLASGSLSLTAVRILRRHLTDENHHAVLAKARGRSRQELDALIAELAPQPDVAPSVRKLPVPAIARPAMIELSPPPSIPNESIGSAALATRATPSLLRQPSISHPIVQTRAPERYRVQFTIGKETHEKLRRLQALLRREIPDGDPSTIFDRALTLLLEKVERAKVGALASPRHGRAIRRETDEVDKFTSHTRHVPQAVKRAVWQRDGGQCAFVAAGGRRCKERSFLEFHHVTPYAKQGSATVANISLRCRRHNQYEAELIFGIHGASIVRERGRSAEPPCCDDLKRQSRACAIGRRAML